MHEMALAQNIVDTIREKVTDRLDTVAAVNIVMGAFSGVIADSLDFGLKTVFAGSDNPEVAVNISQVPTVAQCVCGNEYTLTDIFTGCAVCRSFERKLISGMDVIIQSVEITANGDTLKKQ